MDIWPYRYLILSVSIPALLVIFYLALRVQRWKFSEEIHLSGFDITWMKAKYFILGAVVSSASTAILILSG